MNTNKWIEEWDEWFMSLPIMRQNTDFEMANELSLLPIKTREKLKELINKEKEASKKIISFNKDDALRLYEWGMAYFSVVDHYEDACGVCGGIFKRLEKFIDVESLEYLLNLVKKHPFKDNHDLISKVREEERKEFPHIMIKEAKKMKDGWQEEPPEPGKENPQDPDEMYQCGYYDAIEQLINRTIKSLSTNKTKGE